MEEEGDWWDVMAKMGMPLLYIIGILCGIVGAICQGVITEYWANSEMNSCFLYSKTASSVVVYQFGTSVSVCNWVTYGTVVSIIIAFLAGLVYTVKVRPRAGENPLIDCLSGVPRSLFLWVIL
ncbi:hypothetical protein E2C01_073153 [Portunus trituberculatus]|uniref:Uncharacterized protein n=1 Tax=Portunus trituberculatus TaxID=210409 RepID=A0A5B7I9T6_PORTR|nr:hypothetical protein [Portunus trituberculatus]